MYRSLAIVAALSLAACGPAPQTAQATASAQLSASFLGQSRTALCSRYANPVTSTLEKQMIEVELASQRVNQCAGRNIGRSTAAGFGSQLYDRSVTAPPATADRDCGDFAGGVVAQRFFLAQGGPTRDPHDLDRDGDGLACEWGTEIRSIARYQPPAAPTTAVRRPSSSGRCYTGPRGGTYTITSGGNRNYSGC